MPTTADGVDGLLEMDGFDEPPADRTQLIDHLVALQDPATGLIPEYGECPAPHAAS